MLMLHHEILQGAAVQRQVGELRSARQIISKFKNFQIDIVLREVYYQPIEQLYPC